MLIIPELKSVVIMPPRSGSTALRAALKAQYEQATAPFRHGEVAMLRYIPQVTDEWSVVYMLRDPMSRMQSLWRYMHEVNEVRNARAPKEWIDRVRKDADRPFQDWLLNSTELFNESKAKPFDGTPEAAYCTYWQVPAARKDATWFLRGVKRGQLKVCKFACDADYKKHLGISWSDIIMANSSEPRKAECGIFGFSHINNYFATDLILMGL